MLTAGLACLAVVGTPETDTMQVRPMKAELQEV